MRHGLALLFVFLGAGSLLSGIARLLIGEAPPGGAVAGCIVGAVFIVIGLVMDQRKPKPPV